MRKEEIKRVLSTFMVEHDLEMDEVAIGFGSALVLMDIRERTPNIHLDLPLDKYDSLISRGFRRVNGLMGDYIEYSDRLSVHPLRIGQFEYFSGVRCYSPWYTHSTKIFLLQHRRRDLDKRNKDMSDLRDLERYLSLRLH